MQTDIDFQDKKILDVGCGLGVWLAQFAAQTAPENVFGSDIDPELIAEAKQHFPDVPAANIVVSPAEKLPFADNSFDIVFSNEVMEHVADDQQVMREVARILKLGGKYVFFTPNRGWPFETHGIFIGEKYIWGNIPLLPWLPKFFYRIFAPHVRNYTGGDIRRLAKQAGLKVEKHSHIFPGFDGAVRRFGILGKLIQTFFHVIERTPLHWFGISHYVILSKI
jgi:ubiquinone/menaquinone biosynthesis C-methylase UbiE